MSEEENYPSSESLSLPSIHQTLIDAPGNPELLEQGWQKRFVTDENRVEEAVQLYRELGFEVHSEPLKSPEPVTACSGCVLYASCNYITIYVRKK